MDRMNRNSYLKAQLMFTPPPRDAEEAYELLLVLLFHARMAQAELVKKFGAAKPDQAVLAAELDALAKEVKNQMFTH